MAFIDRWDEDEIIVSSKLVDNIQTFEISIFKLDNVFKKVRFKTNIFDK